MRKQMLKDLYYKNGLSNKSGYSFPVKDAGGC